MRCRNRLGVPQRGDQPAPSDAGEQSQRDRDGHSREHDHPPADAPPGRCDRYAPGDLTHPSTLFDLRLRVKASRLGGKGLDADPVEEREGIDGFQRDDAWRGLCRPAGLQDLRQLLCATDAVHATIISGVDDMHFPYSASSLPREVVVD